MKSEGTPVSYRLVFGNGGSTRFEPIMNKVSKPDSASTKPVVKKTGLEPETLVFDTDNSGATRFRRVDKN